MLFYGIAGKSGLIEAAVMNRKRKITFLVEFGIAPLEIVETLTDDELEEFVHDIFTDADEVVYH